MGTKSLPGAHPSEPPLLKAEQFGGWLTIAEAVTYCTEKRLARTPKTVRKWAHRSHHDPENADLVVRREDVDNGFRWTVERVSLDRKIEQELEFEARRTKEVSDEQVRTSAGLSEQVHTGAVAEESQVHDAKAPEPVRTGAHPPELVHGDNSTVEQLKARIDDLKAQVEFFRDELSDRRQTTKALTDVIEAFRLTAQTNAQNARSNTERSSSPNNNRHVVEGDNVSSE